MNYPSENNGSKKLMEGGGGAPLTQTLRLDVLNENITEITSGDFS